MRVPHARGHANSWPNVGLTAAGAGVLRPPPINLRGTEPPQGPAGRCIAGAAALLLCPARAGPRGEPACLSGLPGAFPFSEPSNPQNGDTRGYCCVCVRGAETPAEGAGGHGCGGRGAPGRRSFAPRAAAPDALPGALPSRRHPPHRPAAWVAPPEMEPIGQQGELALGTATRPGLPGRSSVRPGGR